MPQFKTGCGRDRRPHGQDFTNPGTAAVSRRRRTVSPRRYVRVTATKLAPRQNDYILALAELEAFDADGNNRAAQSHGDRARYH